MLRTVGVRPGALSLMVTLRVRPHRHEAFMAAIAANQRAALAEEPGCLAFVVGRDVDHSDEFHVYELYRDHKALEEHRESAHFLEWRRVASEVLESDGIESRLSHVVMELQSADCSREDQ